MNTHVTRTKNRKVEFMGVEEGHALICESEGHEMNGRMRWNKAVVSLSPEELRKILAMTEDNLKLKAKEQFEEAIR